MAQKCCYMRRNESRTIFRRVRLSLSPNTMRLTGVGLCEIILPTDNNPFIFWGVVVPAVEQNSVEQAEQSDYETYLRQKSLNAALTKAAVFSGVWFAIGTVILGVAILVRPYPNVVGMDPAGREHPLVTSKMPIKPAGAKQ